MVKDIFKIICIFFLFVFAFATPVASADTFLPLWHVGDKWLVKAVYHSPLNKEEWSAPVYWEYKVVAREEHGPESYYILEIKDQKGGLRLTTRLVYRLEDFSLARAEITKTRRGKQIVKVLTYERGAPVETEQSLTPFDTPVFPIHSPSSADFSVIKHVGNGLKATETVRQDVRKVSGTEELPGWPEDRELTEVKCSASDGTIIFVQYWDKKLPWPVYCQNRNMKYWLVQE